MTRYTPPPPKERSVRAFVANLHAGGVTLHDTGSRIVGRRTARNGQPEDVPAVWQQEIDKRADAIRELLTTAHPAPPSPTSRGGTPEPAGRIPASGS